MTHQERIAEMQKDGERYAKDPSIADKENWSHDYRKEVIDYARPIMAEKRRQSATFKNDPAKKVAEEKKEEWHSEYGTTGRQKSLNKMNTNELRDLAVSLGADKKKLYGTSKQSLIAIINKLRK